MIVNPYKHQPMMLGANTIYKFSFPVNDSTDLLDVTIDKDLSLIVTSHRYVRRLRNNLVFSRDLKILSPEMSCYVYTRLSSYHTFKIAL